MDSTEQAEVYWLLDSRLTIGVSKFSNKDGLSLIQADMPFGEGPPLHIHQTEDETFHVLRGTVIFQIGDQRFTKSSGGFVLGPRLISHSFRVLSPEGASLLIVTRGGFEEMVRALGRTPLSPDLPSKRTMTSDMQEEFSRVCAENGMDVIGGQISLE